MRVSDKKVQRYYLKETAEQNWAVRTLERNINTLYYQRWLSSQIKKTVETEMKDKTKNFQQDKYEFIKNIRMLRYEKFPKPKTILRTKENNPYAK